MNPPKRCGQVDTSGRGTVSTPLSVKQTQAETTSAIAPPGTAASRSHKRSHHNPRA